MKFINKVTAARHKYHHLNILLEMDAFQIMNDDDMESLIEEIKEEIPSPSNMSIDLDKSVKAVTKFAEMLKKATRGHLTKAQASNPEHHAELIEEIEGDKNFETLHTFCALQFHRHLKEVHQKLLAYVKTKPDLTDYGEAFQEWYLRNGDFVDKLFEKEGVTTKLT